MCGGRDIEYELENLNDVFGIEECEHKIWVHDGAIFWVDVVKNRNEIKENWINVKEITAGYPNDVLRERYLISKNFEPYLLVNFHYHYKAGYCPDFTLWHNHLVLCEFETVYIVNLLTCEIKKFPPKGKDGLGYCGNFYQAANRFFIASACRLYCFDENFTPIWETEDIACDGVLIFRCENGILVVHGENDPPGGWKKYEIEFSTGEIKSSEWAVTDYYYGLVKTLEEDPEFILRQLRS
jgi:hypothetical protein